MRSPRAHRVGETLAGRYRLISPLGQGGYGAAFRAWDNAQGVPVVLKMPLAQHLDRPVILERFSREVARLRACSHANIVPIIDDGQDDDGRPFIVMRFLPGGSLADRKKPVTLVTLHRWLPGIAAALDYIHSQGVLHRDVKPSNIFFNTQAHAFLGDFGVARLLDEREDVYSETPSPPEAISDADHAREESLTLTGQMMGTLPYMAPELFHERPHLTRQADQYSLAVTVYELLSNSWPIRESHRDAYRQFHQSKRRVTPLSSRVPHIPASLSHALDKALAKSPDERFGSCQEFAMATLAAVPFTPIDPSHRRFLCPGCNRLVRVPDGFGGRSCRCPGCNVTLRVSQDLDALWRPDEDPRPSSPRRSRDSRGTPEDAINRVLQDDEDSAFPTSYRRFALRSMWSAATQVLSKEILRRNHTLGPSSMATAAVLGKLAAVLSRSQRFEEAERMYERALAIANKSSSRHLLTADIAFDCGTLYRSRRQWGPATRLFIQAFHIRRASLGLHPFTVNCWGSIAVVLGLQRLFDRAEPLFVKAVTAYGGFVSEPKIRGTLRVDTLEFFKPRIAELERLSCLQRSHDWSESLLRGFLSSNIHAFAEHFDDGRQRVLYPP